MEEIREVAGVYYKAGPEEIKQLAHDFFNSMDLNGDQGVSMGEYMDFFTRKRRYSQMKNKELFLKLDRDGKGRLGFHDVMTLFYILKSGRPFCERCREFMSGVFFTCVKCFHHHSRSCYSVCLQCYESDDIVHEHQEFLDNFALLEAKRRKSEFPALRTTKTPRKDSHPRGPMKELRQIATAYCRSTSEDIKEKEKIRKFFNSMNYGKHERVALHEFLEFMSQKAKKHFANNNLDLEFMNTPEFFRKLDKDKKGLNFSDVETLYYIIQSGRPFCKGCGVFIEGMFFTCVRCFNRRSTCFSLCLHCYNAKKFIHDTHHHLFLDNYALLEAMGETAPKAKMDGGVKKKNTPEGSTSSPGPIAPLNNKPSTTKAITSSDHALIKKPTSAKDTFEALNVAIAAVTAVNGFAAMASAVCVIL